ncbi:hypothetical protein VTO73DRAFT_7174 [Trametes versicolor]
MQIIRGSRDSAFMNLPSELLLHIAGYLSDDLEALLNLALLSRRLSAIARHELFKVMDIRALEEDYMEEYLHLVRELRAVPPFDHYADFLGAHALHKLTPRNLPRLRAFSIAELNLVRTSWVCQKDLSVLGSISSITTLSLSRVEFFQPLDMLAVICYLPHITALSLDRVTIRGVDTPDLTAVVTNPAPAATFEDAVERAKTRPQLARLALDMNLMAMHVARWLADEPSALTTLSVDPTASDAQFMLPHFGPTVVHLAVPLRSTGPLAPAEWTTPLRQYTALRTLTLYIDAYRCFASAPTCQWTRLLRVLQQGVPPTARAQLDTLTLSVRLEDPDLHLLDDAVCWWALDPLDDVLAGPAGGYTGLKTVEVAVEWTMPGRRRMSLDLRDAADAVGAKIRKRMGRLEGAGKLVVRYGVLCELSDSLI